MKKILLAIILSISLSQNAFSYETCNLDSDDVCPIIRKGGAAVYSYCVDCSAGDSWEFDTCIRICGEYSGSYGTCSKECLFSTVLESDKESLQKLYSFRDNVLATSAAGQKIINLYYALSPTVTNWLIEHPVAKQYCKKVLTCFVNLL